MLKPTPGTPRLPFVLSMVALSMLFSEAEGSRGSGIQACELSYFSTFPPLPGSDPDAGERKDPSGGSGDILKGPACLRGQADLSRFDRLVLSAGDPGEDEADELPLSAPPPDGEDEGASFRHARMPVTIVPNPNLSSKQGLKLGLIRIGSQMKVYGSGMKDFRILIFNLEGHKVIEGRSSGGVFAFDGSRLDTDTFIVQLIAEEGQVIRMSSMTSL